MGCVSSKRNIDFSAEVNFEHFKLLRSVGKGAFGKVCIVMRRDTDKLFAMKYMNKEKCIEKHAVRNVINECRILQMLEHPFIVNLWYAFQDEEDLFFVVDLMLGGDLRFHLNKTGAFAEDRVKLYAVELSLAIEYLHERKIIHRDIKPDNILLDELGHVHLADFNVAAFVPDGVELHVRAGTRPYMAPEVLLKQGYDTGADWWSLGVCLYEMLKGKHPFRSGNPDEVIELITRTPISYPPQWSIPCVNFLQRLLDRDPKVRFSIVRSSMADLKRDPWFTGIDWNSALKKEMTMAFIPDKDKINCDAMYELEEMMLEDNPLHKKKQRLRTAGKGDTMDSVKEKLGAELQLIADKFVVYDRLKSNGMVRQPSLGLIDDLRDDKSVDFSLDDDGAGPSAALSRAASARSNNRTLAPDDVKVQA
eukprot:Opistho-2@50378